MKVLNEKGLAYLWEKIKNKTGTPVGSGMDYFGTTAPENYMFANGSAISRTEYAELFAVIGTTYGAGDGSTTFNLPDKRERVTAMYKEGHANFGTMGGKLGAVNHSHTQSGYTGEVYLSQAQMPSHNHNLTAALVRNSHVDKGQMYNGANQHFLMVGQMVDNLDSGSSSNAYSFISNSALASNGQATISNTGSGNAHAHTLGSTHVESSFQPTLVCNYIIKVK